MDQQIIKPKLVMIQVRKSTRALIKAMAALRQETIPEYLAWVANKINTDKKETL